VRKPGIHALARPADTLCMQKASPHNTCVARLSSREDKLVHAIISRPMTATFGRHSDATAHICAWTILQECNELPTYSLNTDTCRSTMSAGAARNREPAFNCNNAQPPQLYSRLSQVHASPDNATVMAVWARRAWRTRGRAGPASPALLQARKSVCARVWCVRVHVCMCTSVCEAQVQLAISRAGVAEVNWTSQQGARAQRASQCGVGCRLSRNRTCNKASLRLSRNRTCNKAAAY
jgi:hypothetical protein